MPAASSRIRRRLVGLALISSEIWPCRTKAGECAPVEASAKSICTSRARTSFVPTLYAEPASRVMRRVMSRLSLSLNAAGASRSPLSMISATSAKLRAGRVAVPAKITSSIPPPRIAVGRFSPMTQRKASSRLDLPQPLGPTTPVRPSAITKSVGSTKLLKPFRRRRVKRMGNGPLFDSLRVEVDRRNCAKSTKPPLNQPGTPKLSTRS